MTGGCILNARAKFIGFVFHQPFDELFMQQMLTQRLIQSKGTQRGFSCIDIFNLPCTYACRFNQEVGCRQAKQHRITLLRRADITSHIVIEAIREFPLLDGLKSNLAVIEAKEPGFSLLAGAAIFKSKIEDVLIQPRIVRES